MRQLVVKIRSTSVPRNEHAQQQFRPTNTNRNFSKQKFFNQPTTRFDTTTTTTAVGPVAPLVGAERTRARRRRLDKLHDTLLHLAPTAQAITDNHRSNVIEQSWHRRFEGIAWTNDERRTCGDFNAAHLKNAKYANLNNNDNNNKEH